jgi:hypothetical protein
MVIKALLNSVAEITPLIGKIFPFRGFLNLAASYMAIWVWLWCYGIWNTGVWPISIYTNMNHSVSINYLFLRRLI